METFLEGDFGRAVLDEYQGRTKADYQGNIFLNVLSYYHYKDGIVRGSNPFAVVLINQILPEGMRVATPADLETILKTEVLDLKGHYELAALVLRRKDNPNTYLAEDLDNQIQSRYKVEYPIMIPLVSLELVNNSNLNIDLSFNLREDAQIIYAPQLVQGNNEKRFSQTDKNGLPILDKNFKRVLYTGYSGLSVMGLGRELNLVSDWDDLCCSDLDGRIVAVRDEATKMI